MGWHFYSQLSSLLIIVVYAILVFRNVNPLLATAIGVACGFLYNGLSPLEMGQTLATSLSSFLATVGFIIMLGRGLGEVLNETKVSHSLVHYIVYGIGVNTQARVKIGIVLSSLTIVAVLGTLAGGLAILAPLLRPIAARVQLAKPSLAVLMQASGEEALILGPFAPPVVALLGVTGISYGSMLLYAGLPIAVITLITTWIMASKLQISYSHEQITLVTDEVQFKPSTRQKTSMVVFILAFILCIAYGIYYKAATSYVIFVMLFLAIVTGLVSGVSLPRIFELIVEGMKKNFHLFFIFILLDPFLGLVERAGGFAALMQLLQPLEHYGGKTILSILIGLTGAFGMPAASAAVIKMLHQMFNPAALELQLSLGTFAFSMLIATRITNYAIPGPNMFAAMGFAESTNVKAMLRNGLLVTAVQIVFLIIYSCLWN